MKAILRLTTAVLLTLGSHAAIAHGGETETGGFVNGILHPLTGIDHVAAMLALGLWCSQRRTRRAWLAAVAFVVMLTLGAMFAYSGAAFPGVEIAIAASCVVIGAAIMNNAPASTLVTGIVSAF